MGDIAEMMLDGTLCECCGVPIDGEPPGYPRYCSKLCRRVRAPAVPKATKIPCPTCGKRVKAAGLHDHMRDAHSTKGSHHA
jgi:endogenous inhibitor of DNA gyrase (YacG/DUF329 family)